MAQFWISSADPESDYRRCEQSREKQERITITGADNTGVIQSYTGQVQSIEDHGKGSPDGRRYRVTI